MNNITKEIFSENIKKYQQEMYRFAYSIVKTDVDAQDAVGEAIVKAYENRGKLRDINKFKTWIMAILVNESKNILRNKGRYVVVEDNTMQKQLNAQGDSKPPADNGLWDAVMQLEEEFRKIVVLFYYDEFSTKEISKMLRLPEGTVKSRLSRAREKLKELV